MNAYETTQFAIMELADSRLSGSGDFSEGEFSELFDALLNCSASFESANQGILIAAIAHATANRYLSADSAHATGTGTSAESATPIGREARSLKDGNILHFDRLLRRGAENFPVTTSSHVERPFELRDVPDFATSLDSRWSDLVEAARARQANVDQSGEAAPTPTTPGART